MSLPELTVDQLHREAKDGEDVLPDLNGAEFGSEAQAKLEWLTKRVAQKSIKQMRIDVVHSFSAWIVPGEWGLGIGWMRADIRP